MNIEVTIIIPKKDKFCNFKSSQKNIGRCSYNFDLLA